MVCFACVIRTSITISCMFPSQCITTRDKSTKELRELASRSTNLRLVVCHSRLLLTLYDFHFLMIQLMASRTTACLGCGSLCCRAVLVMGDGFGGCGQQGPSCGCYRCGIQLSFSLADTTSTTTGIRANEKRSPEQKIKNDPCRGPTVLLCTSWRFITTLIIVRSMLNGSLSKLIVAELLLVCPHCGSIQHTFTQQQQHQLQQSSG